MEFNNQYLTYEEYAELGGALEETPFNILELEARKNIDKYTFGRLQNLDSQINEVKVCEFKLINLLDTYNSYANQNKGVSSESTDGYSISYSSATENVSKAKINEIKDIIKTYLAECKLEDGTPYLYVGGVKYANEQHHYIL
jgi:hypothetical protein